MDAKIDALGLSTTLRDLPPAAVTLDPDERGDTSAAPPSR